MTNTSESFAVFPSLADRSVLISGGGSGIGAEIVRGFVRQGAKVAFVDLDEEASSQLIDGIDVSDTGHKPLYRHVDVTDIEAYRNVIQDLDAQLGGFDVLVNNAANDQRHAIGEVTPEYWRKALAVNLDHQFFAAQAVAKGMAKRGGGAIVNMGSCSWRVGLDQLSAYVTSKAAIEGLTNGLARELGPDGIRVNCVIPGFIKTERQVKLWLTPELEQIVYDSQCLKELIDPVYVANLVAFLSSNDARMCSSGTYTVDGGWI
ncbi:SDR family NAD(P)-dependent oxidoreductase [Hoeflea prorocentri]|uniref:SDR family NAD(P)-dependent oxidoreductase n=1 Tax=Hoeflea prorocentri TaxID=1922333 RepID=A0A9X3URB1_9HYPH|nr:SDR family oxidoreductase [Hoeflea prorocentri]MCY6383781.1 SDR family NAD(P)-dependent oxidoreductase [Hoeflea prorocentri]MDA5401581.1 SDR family NAD(P)-dependent oxidoreductase [Hoeflea prorocentri]